MILQWWLDINKLKPLLGVFHCREIPQFKQATDKLKIDKLWMKFYPQGEAYSLARQWFLDHKEYTHFITLPDDLLATQQAINILSEDSSKADVIISGWCNNTAHITNNIYTDFSFTLPPIQTKEFEPYNFARIEHVLKYTRDIIPVPFQGIALTFLPRAILEDIPFRTDIPQDLGLAHDLAQKGIPQYIDLRARMIHLRHPHGILVGKREKEIVFESQAV